MSTNTKTAKTTAKKARCKMASPISNDRAEAFVGPTPEILPRFSEVPSERDKRAFELAAQGMTQRQIAKKLRMSQSTVHRGIKKYRLWFGSTLPEDRGELIGWARFRVAVEERKIFLRHQQELAMEEWEQSRQPVKMKRKRTKVDPQGRKMDGMLIKDIQIDEYVQRRHASAAHLNAAAKRSEELTMLEAGYLGVRKLTCDQVIDTDERDRWDRIVKSLEATVEQLTRKVAELEAKLADQCRAGCACLPADDPRAAGRACPTLDESRIAQMAPAVNQTSPAPEVTSPIQNAPSGDLLDSPPPVSQKAESMNHVGVPALAGPADPTKPPEGGTPTLPDESRQSPKPSCLSGAELALLHMQINRLNNRD